MKFRGILAGALAFVLSASLAFGQSSQGTSPLTIVKGGTNASTASAARTNLGLAIGSATQAWDADLDCIAALSGTGIIRRTGAGTCSNGTVSTVAEGGTGLATILAHGILLGAGIGNIVPTAVMTDGQLLVGQSAADPLPKTITGDVTFTAAGATAIGTAKVTYAMLANRGPLSVSGRSANTTGVAADISCVAASDAVLRESGSTLGCGTIATAGIANSAVTNAKRANVAANSYQGNPTTSTAAPSDFTASSLTLKASPVSGDIVVIEDSAASFGLKKTTVGAIASAGSVASVNGQTGAVTVPVKPQGRIYLQSGEPVPAVTRSAKTAIFYGNYQGNQVPIYDGTNFISTPITGGEITVATTDTAKNPAAIGASKVNDWFVWSDSGTMRISHGPDWTSDIARSAGTALVNVNGIALNAVAITNACAIQRCTYVGTTRSNASSQLDWTLGLATGGQAGFLNVWNAYNRRYVTTSASDGSGTYLYTTGTVRQSNGAASAQVSFVVGLSEDYFEASYNQVITLTNTIGSYAEIGIGLDSTTTRFKSSAVQNPAANAAQFQAVCRGSFNPQLGYHFVAGLELGDAVHANTFFGQSYQSLVLGGMF